MGSIKKYKKGAHFSPLRNGSNEIYNSEIYQIRREIFSHKKIKDTLERIIIKRVTQGHLNQYNSFCYLYSLDEIYEQLTKLQRLYDQCENVEDLPKLFGLPIILKDNICTKNIPTTCGSKILEKYKPSYDSTVVRRLKKHGAVIVGKTHMNEFAMGSCTGGMGVKNPFNENELSCGGSSGGSASCVGSRIINCSVNTDTGGSIRSPAALCACIGMKPTYGRISRYGIIPYNEETDVVGLIVNNVYDCSILLDVLSGADKNDLTTLKGKEKKFHFKLKKYEASLNFQENKCPLKNFKFGYLSEKILKNYFVDDLTYQSYLQVMHNIEKMGGILMNTDLHELSDYCYLYYLYSMTIANSNLSRINGINYNLQNVLGKSNFVREVRSTLINEKVLTRIIGGSIISSRFQGGSLRHTFATAKGRLTRAVDIILGHVNFLLLPSLPRSNNLKESVGTPHGGMSDPQKDTTQKEQHSSISPPVTRAFCEIPSPPEGYNNYMKEIFSVVSSITGLPSIVIPTGEFTPQLNEPQSFQLLGRSLNEAGLLK
ncbi:glutamyl-tRNA(Gln) amidotransferase subunit A, partial [Plasmodium cynomolgi strain B]